MKPLTVALKYELRSKFPTRLQSKFRHRWSLGWSDVEFYFWKGDYADDQVYFYESDSKNWRIWLHASLVHAWHCFHFQIFFYLRFSLLHNDPAVHQEHCGRCWIQTQDICPTSLVRYQWATTSQHHLQKITGTLKILKKFENLQILSFYFN